MKEIPLTHGQVALIDDEDLPTIAGYNWYAGLVSRNGDYYAEARIGPKKQRICISMARLIVGAKPGEEADHRNHNTLDNTRSNLRACTHLNNLANKKMYSTNTSGFKGVHKVREKWRALISVGRKRIHLGYYSSPEAAGAAYDQAALRYFGEFALTNQMLKAVA